MGTLLDTMHDLARERDLLERARAGDRTAFDELVRLHLPRVYSLLFRLAGNHEDAEDLAQECFVRAWRSLAFYRGEGAFSTWLYRIALHLARDHYRAAARRRLDALEEGSLRAPRPGPAEETSGRELARSLRDALERLPHRLRAALVLRVLEGLEYADVGRALGVTPATARTHVSQARRLLLRRLGPWLERRAP